MAMDPLPAIPVGVQLVCRTKSKVLEEVTTMLKEQPWTCLPGDEDSSRVFVRTNISGENGTSYRAVLHVTEDHVKVYILCDIKVPESKRVEVAEYIRSVSHNPLHGTFELNASNGELRYKNSVKNEVMTPVLVQTLIAASLLAMDHHFPLVLGICHSLVDPPTAARENSLSFSV